MPTSRSRSAKKGGHVLPPFLLNLWTMLEDPKTDHVIAWSEASPNSFVVKNAKEFEKILGKYFKHNKFPSFVRQLNMYDFYKVRDARAGPTWSHPCLKKGQKKLLHQIKRKNTHEDKIRPGKDYNNDSDAVLRLTMTVENHEERIGELEDQLKVAKRVQKTMQTEMEKAVKHIYGLLNSLYSRKHHGGSHSPLPQQPLIEDSGNERGVKRTKSNMGGMIIKYNGNSTLPTPQPSSYPVPGFQPKSERPQPPQKIPHVDLPHLNFDPPLILPPKESTTPKGPSSVSDVDQYPMDLRLSPSLEPTPPWKFPFSPHTVEDNLGDFPMDFRLDNPFSDHRPLSPTSSTSADPIPDDDTLMTDTAPLTKLEPDESTHNDPSIASTTTDTKTTNPASVQIESLPDEYVTQGSHFGGFGHEFSNSDDKNDLISPGFVNSGNVGGVTSSRAQQNGTGTSGSVNSSSSSTTFGGGESGGVQSSSLPPANLSFTSEQIQSSPGFRVPSYAPSPPPLQSQHKPHTQPQHQTQTQPQHQTQTQPQTIFHAPNPNPTHLHLNKPNEQKPPPRNTQNPFSNNTPFSDPFQSRSIGTSPANTSLSVGSGLNSGVGPGSGIASATRSSALTSLNGPTTEDDLKEKELSNRFQTIHISAGEADGSVQDAELLVQQLLNILANMYRQKGVQGLFPSNYNGFGCWFTNLKTPPTGANAAQVIPRPGESPSEPWAMLLYGLKDTNPSQTAAVMG